MSGIVWPSSDTGIPYWNANFDQVLCFLSSHLLMSLGKPREMIQVLGPLSSMQETWKGFEVPGLGLTHPWLLQPLQQTGRWEMYLYVSFALTFSHFAFQIKKSS